MGFSAYVKREPWDPDLALNIDYQALPVLPSKYTADAPKYDDAIVGVFQEEFWEDMRVKLDTLEETNA